MILKFNAKFNFNKPNKSMGSCKLEPIILLNQYITGINNVTKEKEICSIQHNGRRLIFTILGKDGYAKQMGYNEFLENYSNISRLSFQK